MWELVDLFPFAVDQWRLCVPTVGYGLLNEQTRMRR